MTHHLQRAPRPPATRSPRPHVGACRPPPGSPWSAPAHGRGDRHDDRALRLKSPAARSRRLPPDRIGRVRTEGPAVQTSVPRPVSRRSAETPQHPAPRVTTARFRPAAPPTRHHGAPPPDTRHERVPGLPALTKGPTMTDVVITPTAPRPARSRTRHDVRRSCRTPRPPSPSCRHLLPGQVTGPTTPPGSAPGSAGSSTSPQNPAAVVAVRDVEDVVAAVTCAARHGLSVSAQPVGHGATEALTGTVLLRTGALQEIEIDVEQQVVRVGAGVKWGALLAAVEPTGMIVPAGSSPDPSVVGFTLGGGLSWFSRIDRDRGRERRGLRGRRRRGHRPPGDRHLGPRPVLGDVRRRRRLRASSPRSRCG